MAETSRSLIFSSDGAGSEWDSSLPGSRFTVEMTPALALPENSRHTATLTGAAVFFVAPNVSPALGNSFKWTNTDAGSGPVQSNEIILDQGLYTIRDLSASLSRATLAAGYGTALAPLFLIGADEGAQRVILYVTLPGITINWSSATASPINVLLGYNLSDIGPSVGTTSSFVAPNRADFPRGTSSYILNCSIVSGSYVGNRTTNALAHILLAAAPHSQVVVDSPSTLVQVDVPSSVHTSIAAYITNQAGDLIIVEDPWSFAVTIRSTPKP